MHATDRRHTPSLTHHRVLRGLTAGADAVALAGGTGWPVTFRTVHEDLARPQASSPSVRGVSPWVAPPAADPNPRP